MKKLFCVLGGGVLGALLLGGGGFFFGVSIPADNAGEAALALAALGGIGGFVIGAGVALWRC